jgi:hypothetical protein
MRRLQNAKVPIIFGIILELIALYALFGPLSGATSTGGVTGLFGMPIWVYGPVAGVLGAIFLFIGIRQALANR